MLLALALLARALQDDRRALRLYQAFKRQVIAPLTAPQWTVTQACVCKLAEKIEAGEPAVVLR